MEKIILVSIPAYKYFHVSAMPYVILVILFARRKAYMKKLLHTRSSIIHIGCRGLGEIREEGELEALSSFKNVVL